MGVIWDAAWFWDIKGYRNDWSREDGEEGYPHYTWFLFTDLPRRWQLPIYGWRGGFSKLHTPRTSCWFCENESSNVSCWLPARRSPCVNIPYMYKSIFLMYIPLPVVSCYSWVTLYICVSFISLIIWRTCITNCVYSILWQIPHVECHSYTYT